MKPLTKRKLIDFVVQVAAFMVLFNAGAGFWAFLVVPLSIWNYWDGLTRSDLTP